MTIREMADVFAMSTEISVWIETERGDIEIFKGTPIEMRHIRGDVFENWHVWNVTATGDGAVVFEVSNEEETK